MSRRMKVFELKKLLELAEPNAEVTLRFHENWSTDFVELDFAPAGFGFCDEQLFVDLIVKEVRTDA